MLLRKLQPFISKSLIRLHVNYSSGIVSTSDSTKVKSFQEGNAKLSYDIIKMICKTPTEAHLQ